mgnify:CR=1 FL=1
MRHHFVFTRLAAAATMAGMMALAGSSLAATPGYRETVPAAMQTLVPETAYAAALTRLEAAASLLPESVRGRIAASPCGTSISRLVSEVQTNPVTRNALQMALDGMQDTPPSAKPQENIWKTSKTVDELLLQLVDYTLEWCVALPKINGNADDGMKYIGPMYWFYYKNISGSYFSQGIDPASPPNPLPHDLNFFKEFSVESGAFMDSAASTANIKQWIDDPRIEIADYQKQAVDQYPSWNAFFARQITMDAASQTIPSRPATMPLEQYPERDYIIVAPTDCIMNPLIQVLETSAGPTRRYIENPLQLNTVLDVKSIPISVDRLLGNTPAALKARFVGATGLSCILMPNTYHHFHAPVNGTVRHAEVISGPTFGYQDWANLMPANHNPAQLGTDFSLFEVYQRGVVIIEVTYKDADGTSSLTGYVASIPVGLDTIGSVVLDPAIVPGATIKRGYTRIGNFLYGGSMNLLLFSAGLANGTIQTRLGNQIGLFNVGTTPK